MNLRTIATLAVAIFLGVLAVVLMRTVVMKPATKTAHATAVAGGRPVVVAATAVARGVTLKPEMLKVVNLPVDGAPAESFQTIEAVMPKGEPPRVALRELAVNEPVLSSRISGPGARANLAGMLSPGMRAVTVKSGEVAGVGGFVLPGDHIDILVTREAGAGENKSKVLNVLAQDVRVLGVDQAADADKPTVASAVTVEVTPQQAQTISLAQAVGDVTLALRQSGDPTPLPRPALTVADISGGAPRAAAKARAARPMPSVRVTRGVQVVDYAVP